MRRRLAERPGGARPAGGADGRTVARARSPTTASTTIVRDAIADLGLPLVRMEQRRQRLEDLFRDDASRAAGDAAGGGGQPCRTGRPA